MRQALLVRQPANLLTCHRNAAGLVSQGNINAASALFTTMKSTSDPVRASKRSIERSGTQTRAVNNKKHAN